VTAVAFNTASAELTSAIPFLLGNHVFNMRNLFPKGVTNITFGDTTPVKLPSQTNPTITFPFAGYGLKIGD
jgi:hypothetical protein